MYAFYCRNNLQHLHHRCPSGVHLRVGKTLILIVVANMTANSAAETKLSRKVSFNTRVTVVLIPERKEIKEAQCDLWWGRNDFSAFQQSAHSEIRLYAMYENINCKEAKNMLYQPSENDLTKYDETPELEAEWDLSIAAPSDDAEERESEEVENFSPKLMRHVDSVSLLADYESEKKQPLTPPRRSASTPTVTPDTTTRRRRNSEDDPHHYVSLCVPSKEFEPLVENERQNSADGTCRRSRGRIDQSSGFAVVCGLFSFTLPILGYYLMHYSN